MSITGASRVTVSMNSITHYIYGMWYTDGKENGHGILDSPYHIHIGVHDDKEFKVKCIKQHV